MEYKPIKNCYSCLGNRLRGIQLLYEQKYQLLKGAINMAKNNNGKMSREQAGKKGGKATARNHDQEFYEEIGQKGGEATAKNHDQEFFEEIGEKGGNARARQRSNNNSNNSNNS